MTVREMFLVRHGESEGNVAASAAETAGLEVVDVHERDADVRLTVLGERQATALGRWLADLPLAERPTAWVSSPSLRARRTGELALATAGLTVPVRTDERLRDRELGVLDRLTVHGILARHPEEAERRRHLGKFFHRPPGGESWADVLLRLRSFLRDVETVGAPRLLITCHDVVVLLVRAVLEDLDEDAVMAVARSTSIRNAGVTRVVRDHAGGPWRTTVFNDAGHLADLDVSATAHETDGPEAHR